MSWLFRFFKRLLGIEQKTVPTISSSSPPFIDYGGNIVLPPPASFTQSLMYNFFFTSNGGDKSKLQAILDARLNFPSDSNYRYQAFAADIMLTFATTQQDRSIPESNKGYVAEQEVVCWIPCIEEKKNIKGDWVANRLVWFIPYIVVDNVWALAAGREIFGFPKSMGTFNIPSDPSNALSFTSTTAAFKTYNDNSALQELPFISINRVSNEALEQSTTPFTDSKQAFTAFKDTLLAAKSITTTIPKRFCLHELEDLLNLRMWWVFLKQFRSLKDSTSACYQAIVEGPFNITGFNGGGLLLHEYELTINDLASAPIAQDLGLVSGQTTRAAMWVNVNFNAELGKELWESS